MSRLTVPLGEVIRLKRGHDLPSSERVPGDVPIVSSSGITGYHNVAQVQGPGVVTGRYGTLGEVHYIETDYWPLNTALYVEDFKGNHPRYISYLLQTLELGNQNSAGAVPGVNRNALHQLPVSVTDINTQLRIAGVLSAYDDLIATNLRRIALLEDAARRLYREWFVHLRFLGYESVPVTRGVPEGWQSQPMTECADFINGFAFRPEHQQEVGLPIVKIPELRDGVSHKTPRNSGAAVPARHHIDTGDVLFSWSATLLVNEWSEGPALLNQHLFRVVPRNPAMKRLVRFAVESAIPALLGKSVGATMQHIRRGALDGHLMLLPSDEVADAFAARVNPLMDNVLNLQGQNRRLCAARDSLLPKLMSGQLDVSGIALPQSELSERVPQAC